MAAITGMAAVGLFQMSGNYHGGNAMEAREEMLVLMCRREAAVRMREELTKLDMLILAVTEVYREDVPAQTMLAQMKETARSLMHQAQWCLNHSEEELRADEVLQF